MARSRNTHSETISGIKYRFEKGSLVKPKVQRDLVWIKSQKQLLIDSLLKDYDIPKIYFRKKKDENGNGIYEIVDGQQRIYAIVGFFNDEFPLPDYSEPYNGEITANKYCSQLSMDLQVELGQRNLDVVDLIDYTDDEMEETFLRLQNGTPLKAPEKRRAIPGNMRDVVEDLSKHSFFVNFCEFTNSHFAYEDVAAKALCMFLQGGPCSISAKSLERMYKTNKDIEKSDSAPSALRRAYNFLEKAFKLSSNPHLKKYAAVDLPVIASALLNTFDLSNYPKEFAESYLSFLDEYAENRERDEEEQDPRLISYGNTARGDSLEFLEYRQKTLKECILEKMPYLITKDPTRDFTPEQRAVIYRKFKGICQSCGTYCDENSFHADHIIAHANGGATQISNGQVLCPECNLSKGKK